MPGNDDYAAMEEVLTRRLTALLADEERLRSRPPEATASHPRPPAAGSPTRPSSCSSTAAWAS